VRADFPNLIPSVYSGFRGEKSLSLFACLAFFAVNIPPFRTFPDLTPFVTTPQLDWIQKHENTDVTKSDHELLSEIKMHHLFTPILLPYSDPHKSLGQLNFSRVSKSFQGLMFRSSNLNTEY